MSDSSAPKRFEFTVTAESGFVAEHSDPDKNHYVFVYRIKVRNTGSESAKLLSRHWIITDSHHKMQEVRGRGVVGEQPVIKPGEVFEYTSSCPLTTAVGTMRGRYQCEGEDGTLFEAVIPEIVLSVPRVLH